jgi:hypothetical protein
MNKIILFNLSEHENIEEYIIDLHLFPFIIYKFVLLSYIQDEREKE